MTDVKIYMYCNNCGHQLSENVKFCDKCGKAVIKLDKTCESTMTNNATELLGQYSTIPNKERLKSHKSGTILKLWLLIASIILIIVAAASVIIYMITQYGSIRTSDDITTTILPITSHLSDNYVEPVIDTDAQRIIGTETNDKNIAVSDQKMTILEPPEFRLGSYSSQHSDSTDGVSSDSYDAVHVIDGNIHTAWIPVCEDDGLSPIENWIELTADTPQIVSGMSIVNGFAKDERKYYNNYRVKDIQVVIDGHETLNFVLSDLGCGKTEYIEFPKRYEAKSIRVIIKSVYGTNPKYKEAAISEIVPELK